MNPFVRRFAWLLAGCLNFLLLTGCSPEAQPLMLAPQVDLDRYAGRWYIIANIPYFAERGNVGVTSTSASSPAAS